MKGFDLKDMQNMDISKMTDKMSKSVNLMIWVGVVIGLIGLIIVAFQNWVIALGLLIFVWGNNLEQKGKTAKAEMKKAELQKQAMGMINNIFGRMNQD